MSTSLAWSIAASDIKAARNIENGVGASTHHCFTPVLMLNDLDCSPSYSTHPFMPSCSCRVMLTHLGGHPCRVGYAHRASPLLPAFLLHLTGRENHVRSASSWSETALCFGCNTFRERLQPVQENFRKDLTSNSEQGVPTEVPTLGTNPLLEDGHNGCIFPFLRYFPILPDRQENTMQVTN